MFFFSFLGNLKPVLKKVIFKDGVNNGCISLIPELCRNVDIKNNKNTNNRRRTVVDQSFVK
jgi:hypothetical protein